MSTQNASDAAVAGDRHGDPRPDEASPSRAGSTPAGRQGFLTKRVMAWAAWDVGSSSFDAVVVTFVFSVYLTKPEIFGPSANADLGWTTAVAGLLVALVAPAVGQWTDRTGKSRTVLAVSTVGVIAAMAALFFVEPGEGYLWLGLTLLALGNFIFETGTVVYNSMVNDIATPSTVGRVSGFGWGMGYLGSIVLLAVLLVCFINPDPGLFGVTHEDALHIRVSMVVCAAWMLVFTLPILVLSRNRAPTGAPSRTSGPHPSPVPIGSRCPTPWRAISHGDRRPIRPRRTGTPTRSSEWRRTSWRAWPRWPSARSMTGSARAR